MANLKQEKRVLICQLTIPLFSVPCWNPLRGVKERIGISDVISISYERKMIYFD